MSFQKLKKSIIKYWSVLIFAALSLALVSAIFNSVPSSSSLLQDCHSSGCNVTSIQLVSTGCGSNSHVPHGQQGFVPTSINFLCKGNDCDSKTTGYCATYHNGIIDLLFAIIRFLSDGVGLVVVASVIVGGIQYITSRGDPNGTKAALKRLSSSGIALTIYIFAYAILNYVIPNGFLKQ